jgi:acetyl/propionyl-CoA carboxylase alpha subunit
MKRALEEYELFGVRNNIGLCLWIMNETKFKQGVISTHYLADEFVPEQIGSGSSRQHRLAALSALITSTGEARRQEAPNGSKGSNWLRKREEYFR